MATCWHWKLVWLMILAPVLLWDRSAAWAVTVWRPRVPWWLSLMTTVLLRLGLWLPVWHHLVVTARRLRIRRLLLLVVMLWLLMLALMLPWTTHPLVGTRIWMATCWHWTLLRHLVRRIRPLWMWRRRQLLRLVLWLMWSRTMAMMTPLVVV